MHALLTFAYCATKDIVPTCTVPTIVYIESQPAGRASNVKIGAIALSAPGAAASLRNDGLNLEYLMMA